MGKNLSRTPLANQYVFFLIGIIFVSFNLRPSITAVGPLISSIRSATGLSSTTIGLLTTLPVLAFGVFSVLAPKLGRKYSNEVVIFISLLVLTIGVLLRSAGSVLFLFLGTTLLGLGIASCNVLIVGVIKDRVPKKIGLMTGIYTMTMSLMASLASGTSIPLAKYFAHDWEKTLAVWAILAALALILWLPQLKHRTKRENKRRRESVPIWRSSLAWQVTLFMGFQSSIFYSSIAWLPEILISKGIDYSLAGWMLTFMQLMGLPGNFLIPLLAVRLSNQRGIVAGIVVLYILGFAGIYLSSHLLIFTLAMFFIGIAQGAGISLALTMFGLRTKTSEAATDLSGMAQSGGYLLAALGPLFIGFLFDLFHSWTPALFLFGCFIIGLFITGLLAGRDLYVHEQEEKRVLMKGSS